MKLLIIFVFTVCTVTCYEDGETCKYRKNYISYQLENEDHVNGLTPTAVHRSLRQAFRVWEDTISEIWFQHERFGIYQEPLELLIKFISFRDLFKSDRFIDRVAYTVNNCTDVSDEHQTIHNSTIYFNTDFMWKMNDLNNRNRRYGVNLISVAIHELGHFFGLEDSRNETSVMFPSVDNFNTLKFSHHHIPDVDLISIRKLYFLQPELRSKPRLLM